MEWIELLLNAISNYGFPIAACGVMFWYMNKERQDHKQEVDALRQSLDNNTIVLEKVLTKLGD